MRVYSDRIDYSDDSMFIGYDLSHTPWGQAMARQRAMERLKSIVMQCNHANEVYPRHLADILKKLKEEYENLCTYNHVIENYNKNRLRYDLEQSRQIQLIELRRNELMWFAANAKDNLLNPHHAEQRPAPCKKKGFLESLFG